MNALTGVVFGLAVAGHQEFYEAPIAGVLGQGRNEIELLADSHGGVRARGGFETAPALRLVSPPGYGPNVYFPGQRYRFRDGMVRVRFFWRQRPDLTLLVRSAVNGQDLEHFDAYGLTIQGGELRFSRFEDGFAQSMDTSVTLDGIREHSTLEAVLTMVGPHLSAQLFDGKTLEFLGALMVTDERFVEGEIGLRLGRQVSVTSLSVSVAGQLRRPDPDALVGSRVVRLSSENFGKLDDSFGQFIVDRDGSDIFLRLDPVGAERFRRTGIAAVSVSDHVPWRFQDPAYAKARIGETLANSVTYKSAEMVGRALQTLHLENTDVTRLVELGKSSAGRSIWALKISDAPERDEREPAILIDAAQHGVELWSTELALDIARSVLERRHGDERVRGWIRALELWVVPLVNPDGRDAFLEFSDLAGRKNARDIDGDGVIQPREGVDINRNFPFAWGRFGERGSRSVELHRLYRGPSAGSEPESQALMKLAEQKRFTAALSIHTSGTVVLPPYATIGVEPPLRDEAVAVAEAMVAGTPKQINGRRYRVRRRLYPVDGVWKDWLRYEHGTVAMVLEGPYHNPLGASVIQRTLEGTRPVWENLFDRTVEGPMVAGWVEDDTGRALAARVDVLGSEPRSGERWLARKGDGFFARYLDDAPIHTLRIEAPGFEALEVAVGPAEEPRPYVLTRHAGSAAP